MNPARSQRCPSGRVKNQGKAALREASFGDWSQRMTVMNTMKESTADPQRRSCGKIRPDLLDGTSGTPSADTKRV